MVVERGRAHSLVSRFCEADFQSNFGNFTTPSLKSDETKVICLMPAD